MFCKFHLNLNFRVTSRNWFLIYGKAFLHWQITWFMMCRVNIWWDSVTQSIWRTK